MISTDYLSCVYNTSRFKKTVDHTIALLRDYRSKVSFDSIAFTGTSGAALAYIASFQLDIPLVCHRKPGINSHYFGGGDRRGSIEGYVLENQKYIILDDMISSGDTIHRIVENMNAQIYGTQCLGIVLYNRRYYIGETFRLKNDDVISVFGSNDYEPSLIKEFTLPKKWKIPENNFSPCECNICQEYRGITKDTV